MVLTKMDSNCLGYKTFKKDRNEEVLKGEDLRMSFSGTKKLRLFVDN